MTKSLLTPSFWSPVARTSTEAVNRPHDWNVLSRPHASSTITSEPMSKILVTPIFYSPVTATKPAVENELDNFTETTTSSSSAAPSSPTLLSSATESTPGYNSPTVTTPVRSNSTSPTTRCRSRRAKLLLIPALPALTKTLATHECTISTPSSIVTSSSTDCQTPKLLTPAFVSSQEAIAAPTHRRRRLPVFCRITSRFE
ncbi:hypothetical protein L917_13129 [Phytophthora nicotianae]|uniref:Uncharacterized protein n=1 Tax=Phytophthora nicotianae TaxID=4792 RepID=W2KRE3_PHYNI|nr:hypothetical protein L917_13129 [Phytophthora nicotianae]